jgi:hypothetical protein
VGQIAVSKWANSGYRNHVPEASCWFRPESGVIGKVDSAQQLECTNDRIWNEPGPWRLAEAGFPFSRPIHDCRRDLRLWRAGALCAQPGNQGATGPHGTRISMVAKTSGILPIIGNIAPGSYRCFLARQSPPQERGGCNISGMPTNRPSGSPGASKGWIIDTVQLCALGFHKSKWGGQKEAGAEDAWLRVMSVFERRMRERFFRVSMPSLRRTPNWTLRFQWRGGHIKAE